MFPRNGKLLLDHIVYSVVFFHLWLVVGCKYTNHRFSLHILHPEKRTLVYTMDIWMQTTTVLPFEVLVCMLINAGPMTMESGFSIFCNLIFR
jgi:hypothetical protein